MNRLFDSGHDKMQYVEENERLRAILGEWSARAAKVTVMEPSILLFQQKHSSYHHQSSSSQRLHDVYFNSWSEHLRPRGYRTWQCRRSVRNRGEPTKEKRPDVLPQSENSTMGAV